MNAIEKGFMPLPEAHTDRLNISIPLPDYVDQDGLGVNVRRIHSLMRLAGIAHLGVMGEGGDVSTAIPTIVGRASDGTAYAGKIGLKKASLSTAESNQKKDQCVVHGYNWNEATVRLNMDEITQRISHSKGKKANLRDSRNWSLQLNKAFKDEISALAVNHLIKGMSLAAIVASFEINGLAVIAQIATSNSLLVTAIYETMGNIVLPQLAKKGHELFPNSCEHEKFRMSLIAMGPQLDRAAMTKLVSKTSTLVRPI